MPACVCTCFCVHLNKKEMLMNVANTLKSVRKAQALLLISFFLSHTPTAGILHTCTRRHNGSRMGSRGMRPLREGPPPAPNQYMRIHASITESLLSQGLGGYNTQYTGVCVHWHLLSPSCWCPLKVDSQSCYEKVVSLHIHERSVASLSCLSCQRVGFCRQQHSSGHSVSNMRITVPPYEAKTSCCWTCD